MSIETPDFESVESYQELVSHAGVLSKVSGMMSRVVDLAQVRGPEPRAEDLPLLQEIEFYARRASKALEKDLLGTTNLFQIREITFYAAGLSRVLERGFDATKRYHLRALAKLVMELYMFLEMAFDVVYSSQVEGVDYRVLREGEGGFEEEGWGGEEEEECRRRVYLNLLASAA